MNFDVLVNMAAPGCKCSCPLGMGGKQELSGMTILEIKRLWVNGMKHDTLSLSPLLGLAQFALASYNKFRASKYEVKQCK